MSKARIAAWCVAGVLALWAIGTAAGIVNVFAEGKIAKVTAAPKVEREVFQPQNVINNVTFFTTRCEAVKRDYENWKSNEEGYERAANLARTDRTQGEAADAKAEAEQLSTGVTGALQVLHSDAAEYNAKSINYTANPFRSKGLPYKIELPSTTTALASWTPPNCG